MKANETTLQPILEGTKQFVIPLFQRVYCWTRDEWEELWDDLLDLYHADTKREHFMGALVTMPVDMSPHGVSKYLLIDGQQRLTTLFIILAAIRDLNSGTDEIAEQIDQLYLINQWGKGQNRLKLLPTDADRAAFLDIIEGKQPEKCAIADGYAYFKNRLRGKDLDGNQIDVHRLHDTMMKQLAFVGIVLDSGDSPYRIFHSLNGKGVPLTQADLVRNHFFMHIPDPDDQQIAYNELWFPMQESLGEELTNFLWRYLTKDGSAVRQDAIYDTMRLRMQSMTPSGVIDVLSEMHTYAEYYLRLISPKYEPDLSLRRHLERINRWEINTAYPFLLSVYDDYKQHRIGASDFCRLIRIIESYVVRRFFSRIPTNALNTTFISMCRVSRTNVVAAVEDYLLSRGWPNDEEFLVGWERLPIYTSGTQKCRHILESLENRLADNNEPVDLAFPRISIEHIMPQNLSAAWEEALGPNANVIKSTYLHTIGNLTLTGKNEEMGNQSYDLKRAVFAVSNFKLNQYFDHCVMWDGPAVAERAQVLGKTALRIWMRPASDIEEAKADDPTGHKPTGFDLLGQRYMANTWRDVLLLTCSVLASYHGASFAAKAAQVSGTTRQYVAVSPSGMINPAQIKDTDLWVETNQSARSVISTIYHIMAACGHTDSEFKVFW